MIELGDGASFYEVNVLERGYSDGAISHDQIVEDLDGNVAMGPVMRPRTWRGVIDIVIPADDGLPTVGQLRTLYEQDRVILREDGTPITCIWLGDFSVRWESPSSKKGIVPVYLVEVF